VSSLLSRTAQVPNGYHGIFLWGEVATACPLFLYNNKIKNAQGHDVANAHCLLTQRPGFSPKAVCVGFLVDKSGAEMGIP
jgi:hypothetical protein